MYLKSDLSTSDSGSYKVKIDPNLPVNYDFPKIYYFQKINFSQIVKKLVVLNKRFNFDKNGNEIPTIFSTAQ